MKLQLWRNATIQLKIHNTRFLIDPMLGHKASLGEFPWTEDGQKNPLVDLPFTDEELIEALEVIDAVVVSHLHPDHWDKAAVMLLEQSKRIYCPEKLIQAIRSFGFTNVREITDPLAHDNISIHVTDGQHGQGEIGEKMGEVKGFVFEYMNQRIYIAGDTIWCDEVKAAIDQYQPAHIIVAGGAATFAMGSPVTMTFEDIEALCAYTKKAKVWVTHLESISPCTQDRKFINQAIENSGLKGRCRVLEDGEEVDLI